MVDISLLKGFDIIFPLLFVWVVVYAILEWKKPIGDHPQLHAVIAFSLSFMLLLADGPLAVVMNMAPWFLMFLIFAFFLMFIFMFFGLSHDDIGSAFDKKDPAVIYWVIIIMIIIFAGSLGQVYFTGGDSSVANVTQDGTVVGSELGDVGGTGQAAFFATIFHPKVLGMFAILMIAVLTIKLLSGSALRPK